MAAWNFNNNVATCLDCGFQGGGAEPIDHVCDATLYPAIIVQGHDLILAHETPGASAAEAAPSLARQAWSYAAAVARWMKAGQPTRTDEEVAAVLAICQACPHYKPLGEAQGQCLLCGCGCSADASALSNKLRMATEHCPDEPAQW